MNTSKFSPQLVMIYKLLSKDLPIINVHFLIFQNTGKTQTKTKPKRENDKHPETSDSALLNSNISSQLIQNVFNRNKT